MPFTLKDFKEKKAEIQQRQQELNKEVKEIFASGAKELFELNPDLQQIAWTQYTPYFNDGDACYFSVHDFAVNSGDEYWESGDPLEDFYTSEEIAIRNQWMKDNNRSWISDDFIGLSPERTEEARKIIASFEALEQAVGDFMGLFDQDDFEFMFGDHAAIVITKDGISVEEYSHD